MSKYQFKVLVAGLGFLILLMLWTVLPPAGWLWLGLLVLCAGIYWLAGVMVCAVGRVWRQR